MPVCNGAGIEKNKRGDEMNRLLSVYNFNFKLYLYNMLVGYLHAVFFISSIWRLLYLIRAGNHAMLEKCALIKCQQKKTSKQILFPIYSGRMNVCVFHVYLGELKRLWEKGFPILPR